MTDAVGASVCADGARIGAGAIDTGAGAETLNGGLTESCIATGGPGAIGLTAALNPFDFSSAPREIGVGAASGVRTARLLASDVGDGSADARLDDDAEDGAGESRTLLAARDAPSSGRSAGATEAAAWLPPDEALTIG